MRTQIANLTRILLTGRVKTVVTLDGSARLQLLIPNHTRLLVPARDQPPAPAHGLPPIRQARGFAVSETVRLSPSNDAKISANPKKYSGVTVKCCCKNALAPDLQVRDELGKQVEVGQSGELVARGANVMRGYWSNAEETALAFLR
jgi:acyl-CoA synthetase (AMP-forming)/AMP-acid ligase II